LQQRVGDRNRARQRPVRVGGAWGVGLQRRVRDRGPVAQPLVAVEAVLVDEWLLAGPVSPAIALAFLLDALLAPPATTGAAIDAAGAPAPIMPIPLTLLSVNQRLPSGPAAIPNGSLEAVGPRSRRSRAWSG